KHQEKLDCPGTVPSSPVSSYGFVKHLSIPRCWEKA
ncbi:MAG: hypothetical protein ACI8YQ_005317, partial [Polaribacter sp.]